MFAKKNRPSISSLDMQSNIEDDDEMFLRKRIVRDQSPTIIDRLDNDELSELSEEEDLGCPLPSTPEDNNLLEQEVRTYKMQKLHLLRNIYLSSHFITLFTTTTLFHSVFVIVGN